MRYPDFRNRSDALVVAAWLLVILSVGLVTGAVLKGYLDAPYRDLSLDVDWGYLNRGLDRVQGFGDTGRWWTGTWCGEVPFWRPVTSYVFWGMRLLWPAEYMLPRQIVSVALHLIFTALGGLFVWRISRRPYLAMLSVWLFAGFRPWPMNRFFDYNAAAADVLTDPKNLVDPLVGIFIILSLILLIRGRWVVSLAAACVSVMCKEVGFVTWALAPVALAWMHQDRVLGKGGLRFALDALKRNRLQIGVWLGVLVALAVIHYLAVGVGYNCGTNRSWPVRAGVYFGGPIGAQVFMGYPNSAIAAILLFGSLLSLRRYSVLLRFGGVLAALAVAILIDARLDGVSWDVSAVKLLSYNMDLKEILVMVFWLAVAWEARKAWRPIVFASALCLIASAPSWMAAQVLEHARYTASFFMEVVVAAAIYQSASTLWYKGVGFFTPGETAKRSP